jgi:two-component system cell cycle sensor histidine kinase/response regulator CckA
MKIVEAQESRRLLDGIAVAAAVLASIALIQYATDNVAATLAFAGGLVVLGLIRPFYG